MKTKPLPKLFDDQPRITVADRRRLEPHLTGWNKVQGLLVLGTIPQEDLKRLIVLETETRKRKVILQRLVGRYFSNQRKQLMDIIHHA